mmetsp:Transcript_24329/g.57039  ORF Transcript_24329/g.57039 Transcript_24329/m.57039 type:complete len:306 (+) Transcript_24329:724-1641(+)
MDSGRTDRMPHLDRKRPGGRTSPGARGEVTKSLSLNKRKAMRTGMRMPKTLLDCFSGALLGALTAATAGLSMVLTLGSPRMGRASLEHWDAFMPLGMARMTSLAWQKALRRSLADLAAPVRSATPVYVCVRRLSSVALRAIWLRTSATTALSESNSSWRSSKRRVSGSMRRRTTWRGEPGAAALGEAALAGAGRVGVAAAEAGRALLSLSRTTPYTVSSSAPGRAGERVDLDAILDAASSKDRSGTGAFFFLLTRLPMRDLDFLDTARRGERDRRRRAAVPVCSSPLPLGILSCYFTYEVMAVWL